MVTADSFIRIIRHGFAVTYGMYCLMLFYCIKRGSGEVHDVVIELYRRCAHI